MAYAMFQLLCFKYLEATLSNDRTCLAEIQMRIASTTAAMAKLNRFGRCNTISFASQFKLYSLLLYGCETWTLLAASEKKDPGFETKCLTKPLRITCLEHKSKDCV